MLVTMQTRQMAGDIVDSVDRAHRLFVEQRANFAMSRVFAMQSRCRALSAAIVCQRIATRGLKNITEFNSFSKQNMKVIHVASSQECKAHSPFDSHAISTFR